MSSKNYSLVIEEAKDQRQEDLNHLHFEPQLKVLINKRHINDSVSAPSKDAEPVKITGRMTISF